MKSVGWKDWRERKRGKRREKRSKADSPIRRLAKQQRHTRMVLDAFDSGSRDRVSTGNQRHQRDRDKRERESSFKLHSAQFNYTASVSPRLSRRRRNALALLLALVQTQWPVKSHLHRDTNAIVHAGVNKLKETEASIQMERYGQLLWGTSTSRR